MRCFKLTIFDIIQPVPDEVSDHNKKVAENRLSSQIFALIEHFHQEDPLGIPGAPVILLISTIHCNSMTFNLCTGARSICCS